MKLMGNVNIRKSVVFCLIVIIMLSSLGNYLPALYAQETGYEYLAILLNNARSARYRLSDSEGNVIEMAFQILGDDSVGGEAAWRIRWEMSAAGEEPEIATIWISKSTGKCLKIEIDGETYTGSDAEWYWVLLGFWFIFVGAYSESFDVTTVSQYELAGYGRLVFLSSETRTYGPSQLFVYKYRWEGYASAPEDYSGVVEWWIAPTSFGSILVYMYGESDGDWLKVELLSVELVSPQPRPSIVVSASLDKTQLRPNEEATVNITVSNTGNAAGSHNVTVTLDGVVKKSWLVNLNPGESKSLSYKLYISSVGSYVVRVGDRTFTVTVSTTLPARFEVSNLNVNPNSLKTGQSTTISVSIKNTGGESGSYEVILKVNNQAVETKTGTLSPDQSTTVSFTYTPQNEGTYSIDVNGLTGSLTVSKEVAGPGLGIPTEMIIIIIVVVAVVVVLVVILMRRKPKPPPTYAPQPPPPPPPQ